MRRQVIIARDRLLGNIRRIEEWLDADPKSRDRNDLLNLQSELTAAMLRLYSQGPTSTAGTLPQQPADDDNYSKFEPEPRGPFHSAKNKSPAVEEKEKELSYSEEGVRQQNEGDIDE